MEESHLVIARYLEAEGGMAAVGWCAELTMVITFSSSSIMPVMSSILEELLPMMLLKSLLGELGSLLESFAPPATPSTLLSITSAWV